MLRTILVAASLLATPALAETVTIETYKGEADVPLNPATIAVYDVSALDTLDALGVKADGVLTPHYVPYLDKAAEGAEPVGSFFEPDFEALAALNADLVVAGGRSSSHLEALSKIAPTIDMTIWEDTVGQGWIDWTPTAPFSIGKTKPRHWPAPLTPNWTKPKRCWMAKAKLDPDDQRPESVGLWREWSFWLVAHQFGLGRSGKRCGAIHPCEAASFEFIKDTNPDILIVIDRLAAIGQDGESAKKTLDNSLVHDTNAWKNGQVVYLSSAPLYIAGGGIQSMNIILDDIQAAFKGE